MATKAGVWIDHKQAIVVLVTAAGQEIKKIAFDIGQPVRSASRARSKHSYTPKDFVAEDKLERKAENDRKDYYDDVIAFIRDSDSLLVLGPGEAKGEFRKRIMAKNLRGLPVELETADKMTERQVAAKVKEHFEKTPDRKSVDRKNTAKSLSRKRRVKPGRRINEEPRN